MKGVFDLPAWMKILPELENKPLSKVSKKLNITYCHCTTVLNALERRKWITKRKKGRCNSVVLTTKGRLLADKCYILSKVMRDD